MTPGSRRSLALVIAAAMLAACGSDAPSPGPTVAESLPGLVVGCASIEEAECQILARRIVAALPAGRGQPFDVQISLAGCPNGAPCPRTVAARGGIAYVEFADGTDTLTYSLGGEPPILGPLDNVFSGPITPSSVRVSGPAPVPFQLGHCGLSHVVDFDGSFWVPVGQLDGEAFGFINSEAGQMQLLGPNLAQYRGRNGFAARLARFPSPKQVWLCD